MFLQRPYGHSWSGVEGKIAGLGSCGKIFLIIPLTEIYNTFLNPSSSKHAFVGSDNKELIFLNDLKWNQEMIPWQEFLNLLGDQSVHLAAKKAPLCHGYINYR